MKKILVTGAGGFIGYNLCKYLTDQGHKVIGVDLHYPSEIEKKGNTAFQAEIGDFRDWEHTRKLLSGVDVVFHLASAHLQINLDKKEYWSINVHSLPTLLDLALKSEIKRFVHVSSVGVYGNLEHLPADEETPCKPQSIYGETKLAGEAEVLKFSERTGLPAVILRPAWVYGPHCPRTQKLYNALHKGRFFVIGKGMNLRHPLYISDMTEAFRLAMEVDSALGEVFIIGGEKAITTNELVKSFCSVMGFARPRFRVPYWVGSLMAWIIESSFAMVKLQPPISKRTLEFFDTNNSFDTTKAQSVLGFKPKFSFEAGLLDSMEWLGSKAIEANYK
jgi:nucleoside-diphosphate-sugar epimerase